MVSPSSPPSSPRSLPSLDKLRRVHRVLQKCTACPQMIGPVVHGAAIDSRILLVGQAPGPHEGKFGKPFAWTAGKTLFRWFEEATGATEEVVRERVYFAAVARCFPGKAPNGGDRRPDPGEIARCRPYLEKEVDALAPKLVIPVGTLAIDQVLGALFPKKIVLTDVIGKTFHTTYHGAPVDVVALPHPSGASTWHKMEPGKTLLGQALGELRKHPEMKAAFARTS